MPNLGRPTKATDEVPPLDFDGYFTGAWDFEWTVPESALGPAGPVNGTTTYKPVGNDVFEAESKGEGPNGPFTVKERIEYQKEQEAGHPAGDRQPRLRATRRRRPWPATSAASTTCSTRASRSRPAARRCG